MARVQFPNRSDAIGVKAIVAAVDEQYVEELSEDYIGYKNQTIATMITHLQTWFVITDKEKLDMKALFYAPWSETPNTHLTTFARHSIGVKSNAPQTRSPSQTATKLTTLSRKCIYATFLNPSFSTTWRKPKTKHGLPPNPFL